MRIGKSIITISAMVVLLFVGVFSAKYLTSQARDVRGQENSPRDNSKTLNIVNIQTKTNEPENNSTPSKVDPAVLEAPSVAERIDDLTHEIGALSDADLSAQAEKIKSEIYEADLIERLNRDQVTEKERTNANESFLRLALLGIEKAKRGLKAMEPELELSLKKHHEDMVKLRAMLNDIEW